MANNSKRLSLGSSRFSKMAQTQKYEVWATSYMPKLAQTPKYEVWATPDVVKLQNKLKNATFGPIQIFTNGPKSKLRSLGNFRFSKMTKTQK